jgi:hypothetical protein
MSKQWDRLTKMLLAINPQHLVNWLLPGARYKGERVRELIALAVEADILFDVVLPDGQEIVLHVEIQRGGKRNIGRRLWEYNVMTILSAGLPVLTVVIYLYKDPKDPQVVESPHIIALPTGEEIHRFQFKSIKLWELSREIFKQHHLEGLLPLLPLTKDGAKYEVVEEMIAELQARGREDLLSLGYAFASLVFKKTADKAWLKWRFKMLKEILEESWAYQEMVGEASEKAREQERSEQLQRERILLVSYVETRFPELLALAKECANVIASPAELDDVIVKLFPLQETYEVRSYLLNILRRNQA